MRISKIEKHKFIMLGHQLFGEAASLYLFGSRIDDDKRGGDIDLYIETSLSVNLEQKI